MTHIRRFLLLSSLLGLLQLTACSKTVQWEEEVPLNTGEVIWVKREVTYKYKGAGGNPLDMDYLTCPQTPYQSKFQKSVGCKVN
jgi:hypothetical protein